MRKIISFFKDIFIKILSVFKISIDKFLVWFKFSCFNCCFYVKNKINNFKKIKLINFKSIANFIVVVNENRRHIFVYAITTIFASFCAVYLTIMVSFKLYGEFGYSISENFISENIVRNLNKEGLYVDSGNISFKDRNLNIAVDNFVFEKGVFMDARDFYISIDFLKAIFGIIDIKSLNLVIDKATFDLNMLEKNKSEIYKNPKDLIYAFKLSLVESLKRYGNIDHVVIKFDDVLIKYDDMKYHLTKGILYNSIENNKRKIELFSMVEFNKNNKFLGKEKVRLEIAQINENFFDAISQNKFKRIELSFSNLFNASGLVNIVDDNIKGYLNFIDLDAKKMKYYKLLSDDFVYNKKISVFAKIKNISFHHSEIDLKINLDKEQIKSNVKFLAGKIVSTLEFKNIQTLDAIELWPQSAATKARVFIRDHILGKANGEIIIDTLFNENFDTDVKIDMLLDNAKLRNYLDLPDFKIKNGHLTLNGYKMKIKYKNVLFGGNGCGYVKSNDGVLNIDFNYVEPILNLATGDVDGDVCAIKKNFYDETLLSASVRDVVSYSTGRYVGEFALKLDFNKKEILQKIVLNGQIKNYKSYYKSFKNIQSDAIDLTLSEKYLTIGGKIKSGMFEGNIKAHYDMINNNFNSAGKGIISANTLYTYNINHIINSDEDMEFSFDVKNDTGFVRIGLSNKKIMFFNKYEKNKSDLGLMKVYYKLNKNNLLNLGVNLDIVGEDNVKIDLNSVIKSGDLKLLSINEYKINKQKIRGYYYENDKRNSEVKLNLQNLKITKVKEVFDVIADKNNFDKAYESFTKSENIFDKVAKVKAKEVVKVKKKKRNIFENKKIDIVIYGKNVANAKNNVANYLYINSIYDKRVIKKFDMDILFQKTREFAKVRYTPNSIYAKTNNFSNLYSMILSDDAFTGGNVLITGKSEKKGEPINGKIILNNITVNGDQKISKLRYLSITGIFSSMKNNGIRFFGGGGDFTLSGAKFNTDNITVYGDGVGISARGDVDFIGGELKLEGSVITGYSISKVISSIPIVGQILTGLDKTSIFTTSYKLHGNVIEDNVKVDILPSSYVPGFFKDIVGKITGDDIVPIKIPSDIFRLKDIRPNIENNFNADKKN